MNYNCDIESWLCFFFFLFFFVNVNVCFCFCDKCTDRLEATKKSQKLYALAKVVEKDGGRAADNRAVEDNSKIIFSYFSMKTLCCDLSLEPSHWDGSNEMSQHVFVEKQGKLSLLPRLIRSPKQVYLFILKTVRRYKIKIAKVKILLSQGKP